MLEGSHRRPAQRQRDLVNLPALVEQIAVQSQSIADQRSVRIVVEVAPDVLMMGDGVELHWVLSQVMLCMLESVPVGSLVIFSGVLSSGGITLSIFEQLSARPAETAECDPWRPADGRTIEARCHSGILGKVLQAHGGRMEMRHRRGKGLHVVIRLPLEWTVRRFSFL